MLLLLPLGMDAAAFSSPPSGEDAATSPLGESTAQLLPLPLGGEGWGEGVSASAQRGPWALQPLPDGQLKAGHISCAGQALAEASD